MGAPSAGAQGWGDGLGPTTGGCQTVAGPEGQGGTAGTDTQVCSGGGVTTIAPAVGQTADVVGPVITGPMNGVVIVAAGNGFVG